MKEIKSLVDQLADRPVLTSLIFSMLVFLVLFAMRHVSAIYHAELAMYDALVSWTSGYDRRMESPPITLIRIREPDLQALGNWPLTDNQMADVLEKILTYQPIAVGVDIYRDLPVEPGHQRLRQLLQSRQELIFIEKFGADKFSGVKGPDVLAGSGRVGFSDVVVDDDGVARRGLLFLDHGDEAHYSFPLLLALAYLDRQDIVPQSDPQNKDYLQLGKHTIIPLSAADGRFADVDTRGYQFMIDFRQSHDAFIDVSMNDLMENNVNPALLTNRLIILGIDAESVKDQLFTPLERFSKNEPLASGSLFHAHVADQLIRIGLHGNRPIQSLSIPGETVLLLLCAMLGGLLSSQVKKFSHWCYLIFSGFLLIGFCSVALFVFGYWIPAVLLLLAFGLSSFTVSAYLGIVENQQKNMLMNLFSRNVSPDVAEQIWQKRHDFLGMKRSDSYELTATVFFSDLENFTQVSEAIGPGKLMEWINHYMELMAGLVMDCGGVVDDYYGDAIKANFGAPIKKNTAQEFAADARKAVHCALVMRKAAEQLNADLLAKNMPPIRLRIGICTGPMIAGFLGSSRRMKYTTVGDTVNTAARLESYGKEIPELDSDAACRILISGSTAALLDDSFRLQPVESLSLKGKSQKIDVYSVLGVTA